MIKGYKAFDKEQKNRHGKRFEEGMTYNVLGPVKFGNKGNGYHFCGRLEDTLRYVDAMNDDIKIAEVIGSGDIVESYDDYYGYYDMYSASSITIVRFLTREEIIEQFMCASVYRVERFVQLFRLTEGEIVSFKEKYCNENLILKAIAYHQENDYGAYNPGKCYVFKK